MTRQRISAHHRRFEALRHFVSQRDDGTASHPARRIIAADIGGRGRRIAPTKASLVLNSNGDRQQSGGDRRQE